MNYRWMIRASLFFALIGLQARGDETITGKNDMVLENDYLRYVLNTDGRNMGFTSKATGADYCKQDSAGRFAAIVLNGKTHEATALSYDAGRIAATFGDSGVRVVFAVRAEPGYLEIEVVSVEGAAPDSIMFINMPLTLAGRLDEPFAACVLALNAFTYVETIPGPSTYLRAQCFARFGLVGAKAAVVACKPDAMRQIMKEVVRAAEDLPQSPIGGPWALDAPQNRGSYIIDVKGDVTEANVDQWIRYAQTMGVEQLDFHTGHSLRFGDYEPDPEMYPNGMESLKAVIDKLHAAGMMAGLHTYAQFIAKNTPWVTPVPHPDLAKDAFFTLAEPLSAEADTIVVSESTEGMSAVTGFQVRNSATIQVGDELITYAGVRKEPPYAFTGCTRGAHGTQAAAHPNGTEASHLVEVFGLFAPDGGSPLYNMVAERTAEVFNTCGFDMIYLDALDASDVFGGGEDAWYYSTKFVYALWERLERPAIMEMSTFHHHLWYVRSRMGAWDVPQRGAKRFIDIHTIANRSNRRMFLPGNLGWWMMKGWNGVQPERSFPDEFEYLLCKCIAADSGLSLLSYGPQEADSMSAEQKRLASIVKRYETLRRSDYFDEHVKERIGKLGEEFTLEQEPDDTWKFRPVDYARHKVAGQAKGSSWTSNNRFGSQPLRLRIEALLDAAPYDAEEAVVLSTADPAAFGEIRSNAGVAGALQTGGPCPSGEPSVVFAAENAGGPRHAAWTTASRTFEPLADVSDKGLGLWVHGDGKGAVLNVQLRCPAHLSSGMSDHYVTLDFEGWRYVELVEPESYAIPEYEWPYCPRRDRWDGGGVNLMSFAYPVFHVWVFYDKIESLSLYLNNVPEGEQVKCAVGPIKSVPLRSVTLRNPTVTVNGETVVFPVILESGSYLELGDDGKYAVYDAKGHLADEGVLEGPAPLVKEGANVFAFAAQAEDGDDVRALVTVITQGASFGNRD